LLGGLEVGFLLERFNGKDLALGFLCRMAFDVAVTSLWSAGLDADGYDGIALGGKGQGIVDDTRNSSGFMTTASAGVTTTLALGSSWRMRQQAHAM
jgi:hypothetical protein